MPRCTFCCSQLSQQSRGLLPIHRVGAILCEHLRTWIWARYWDLITTLADKLEMRTQIDCKEPVLAVRERLLETVPRVVSALVGVG